MAKRRRINYRNLAIAGIVVVVLAGGGYVAKRKLFKPDPRKYLASGEADFKAGDFVKAREELRIGLSIAPNRDPAIWTMWGDAAAQLTPTDRDATREMMSAYNQATQIDPGYLDAQHKLLEARQTFVLIYGSGKDGPKLFDDLRDNARKILSVNPKDTLAMYALPAATIDQWLLGAATDPAKIDDAVKQLQAVQAADPTLWRATQEIARTKLSQADALFRARDPLGARQTAEDAAKLAADALKGHEDVAGLHHALSVVERRVMQLEGATSSRNMAAVKAAAATNPTSLTPGDAEIYDRIFKHWKIAFEEAAVAAKLIDPSSDDYAEIRLSYFDALQTPIGDPRMSHDDAIAKSKADRDTAEAVLRDTLKLRPSQLQTRLALAELVAKTPQKNDEAIALLQENVAPDKFWSGARADFWHFWQQMTLAKLADLQLDKLELVGPVVEAKHVEMVKDVEATYAKLVAALPKGEADWRAQALKGRIELAGGTTVEGTHPSLVDATHTLAGAVAIFPNDQSLTNERFELKYRLAQAYVATQQTGEAKKELRQIVDSRAGILPARILLADLLIREHNIKGNPPDYTDGAITQVDELEKVLGPDNQGVIRLRLATLDKDKDKDKIQTLFNQIPEVTVSDRYNKAALAEKLERPDDVDRLLRSILAEQPALAPVVQTMVHTLLAKSDKAGAEKVIDDALAKEPDNATFKNMKAELTDPTGGAGARQKQIDAIADPVKRNLAQSEAAQAVGDNAKAMECLQAAEKIEPDNPAVLERMFLAALDQKDWIRAGTYLEKLRKQNVDQANGRIYEIRLAAAQNDTERAFSSATQLTKDRPEFSQSWAMLGMVQQLRQKYDDAIGSYQQALDRQTENTDAIRGLITCYLATNRPGHLSDPATGQKATDARYYIELGEKLYPNAPGFQEMDAQWQMRFGDPDRVVEMRKESADKNPDSIRAAMALAEAYVTAAGVKNKDAPPGTLTPAAKADLTRARDVSADAMKKFDNDSRTVLSFVEAELQLKEIDPAEKAILALADTAVYKGKPTTVFMLSDFYVRAGMPEKSESVMRRYLAANPTAVPVEVRLATQLSMEQKPDDALKVLTANAGDPSVQNSRIDTLLRAQRIDEATKSIDAALATNPTPPLQKLRVRLDIALHKPEDAIKRLDAMITAAPDDYDAIYLRGVTAAGARGGDLDAATDDLNKVLNAPAGKVSADELVDARVQMAGIDKRRGLDDEAIKTLETAISQMPDGPQSLPLRIRLLDYYASTKPPRWFDADRIIKDAKTNVKTADSLDLANAEVAMWIQRQDPVKAAAIGKAVITKAPDNPSYAQNYYAALLESKNYKGVLAETDATLKKHPEWWWIYPQRAAAKKRGDKDLPGAAAEFQAGIQETQKLKDDGGTANIVTLAANELKPTDALKMLTPLVEAAGKWQILYAEIQKTAGDVPGATSTAEKALADPKLTPPQREDAMQVAATLYLMAKPPENAKAIALYQQLVKTKPDDPTVLNNLAFLLLETGPSNNPKEAVQYSQHVYDLAAKKGTVDPLILDTHGWALVQAGRVDEGIALLRDAMQQKQFVDVYYHLGTAYLKKSPPMVGDAERTFLDGQKLVLDNESNNKPVDPEMKANLQHGMDSVKLLKK